MRFTHYCLAAALLAGGAPSLAAQIRASERATVSQVVDGTRITVDYSRPRARGRAALFGGEVKWNEVWTPGANDATTLEIDRDTGLLATPACPRVSAKRSRRSSWPTRSPCWSRPRPSAWV